MTTAPPFLPYGRQWIDAQDEAAVLEALRSPLIAHGPRIEAFEAAFAETVGAKQAVACSSGTAALHLSLATLDPRPGDVAIIPAVTFLATATAAVMAGFSPRFCDVDPDSGLITPDTLSQALEGPEQIRVALPVHLGGAICDMDGLRAVAKAHDFDLIEDGCHAIGGSDAGGRKVGSADLSLATTFSLHPVKTLTSGEGGVATLNDPQRAERMRRLRNHGVTRDPALMTSPHAFSRDGAVNPWAYEQLELGFNYRMNELEAALGLSQLRKLPAFAARRRALCLAYDLALMPFAPRIRPAASPPGQTLCRHLYQVLIDFRTLDIDRADAMRRLQSLGVGTQVHYIPLYRQPYFQKRQGDVRMPGAEAWYERVLALPLFPQMADDDVPRVVDALVKCLSL